MNQGFFNKAFALVLLIIPFAPAQAAELDLDSDGRSDVIVVDITDSGLEWSGAASAQSFAQSTDLGSLGENGDMLAPGSWTAAGSSEIGVATYDSDSDKVSIKVSDGENTTTVEVGDGSDIVISGGDYDGNGVFDTVAINSAGAATVKLNPFAGGTSSSQINFAASAASGAQGIFLNRSGTKDEVGLLKTRKIGSRNYFQLSSSDLQNNTFRKRFASSRGFELVDAVPIAQSDGTDSILFYEKRGSRRKVTVYSLAGTRQYQAAQTRGTLLVGDYLADVGEEFAIYRGGTLRVFNPFTAASSTFTGLTSGVPADHVNIDVLSEDDGGSDGGGGNDGGGGGDVSGCSSTVAFPSTHIYKTIGSTHFDPGDVRRNTAGLILERGASGPFPSCIYVLDSAGTQIGAMGLYQTGNGWAARYYGGIGCGSSYAYNGSALASRARANTGSPNILFKFGDSCRGPIDASRCVGSSQC